MPSKPPKQLNDGLSTPNVSLPWPSVTRFWSKTKLAHTQTSGIELVLSLRRVGLTPSSPSPPTIKSFGKLGFSIKEVLVSIPLAGLGLQTSAEYHYNDMKTVRKDHVEHYESMVNFFKSSLGLETNIVKGSFYALNYSHFGQIKTRKKTYNHKIGNNNQ